MRSLTIVAIVRKQHPCLVQASLESHSWQPGDLVYGELFGLGCSYDWSVALCCVARQ